MTIGPSPAYPFAEATCDECGRPITRQTADKHAGTGHPMRCQSCTVRPHASSNGRSKWRVEHQYAESPCSRCGGPLGHRNAIGICQRCIPHGTERAKRVLEKQAEREIAAREERYRRWRKQHGMRQA